MDDSNTLDPIDQLNRGGIGHNGGPAVAGETEEQQPGESLTALGRRFLHVAAVRKAIAELDAELKAEQKLAAPTVQAALAAEALRKQEAGLVPESNLQMTNGTVYLKHTPTIGRDKTVDPQKTIASMRRRPFLKNFLRVTYETRSLSAYFKEMMKEDNTPAIEAEDWYKANKKKFPPGLTLQCVTTAAANNINMNAILGEDYMTRLKERFDLEEKTENE